ncbi:MAG: YcgN family cysteine cluster protein [Alcanivorax sp.]|nr:YcgN family cysteine cluster protein [Alcanivorax sp.]
MRERFWEQPLEQLDQQEWEALCDGCGRCCLVKLEDEFSGELFFTDVVCRFLDHKRCQCTVYGDRHDKVPECLQITAQMARDSRWLPRTCAYRLRAQGQPLPGWHPLISGRPDSARKAGISVTGKVVSEASVDEDDWEEHIIHWVS